MNAQISRLINADGGKQTHSDTPSPVPLSHPTAFADPLWPKLTEFQFDPPDAQFHFATRLARENGWSPAFTARVLDEYRRFLFLAVRAGHPVSPSDTVDQAWHLHLVYTESYWGDLCPRVLGQPFHHGPSKGGHTEEAKFTDWYARTLESYARYFGQSPPADIWPPVAARFGAPPPRYQRVSLDDAWVIPKPRLFHPRAALACAGLAAIPLILAESESDSSNTGLIIVGFFVLLAIVALLSAAKKGGNRRGGNDGGCGGEGGGCGSDNSGGGHHGGHGGGHDGGGGHGGHGCGGHGCGGHGCGGGGCGGGCGGGGH